MVKILVVEDDADLAETYTDLLRARGYTTTSASNVRDAIQPAVSTQPSAIILDLNLPGSSGIGVLDFIRSHKPLEKTLILVVTGHSEMTNSELVDKADLVLSKPVTNEQLLAMIERLLRLSQATSLSDRTMPKAQDGGSST